MIPEEYAMMELMAMQQFSASSDPYSAHASCSVGWKLLVEVNVKAGYAFWPTGQITIFLERVGAITGLKKGEAKNLTATRTMIRRDTSARFEGISKKKYKIRVLIDQENWFQWTSAEVARTLNDGDDVTVQIDGVCQDEPVSAQGDAVVGDGNVAVRADRLGGENGRAYQIDFTATAGDASCQGSVLVLVPHDRGDTGHHAVDAPIFNSLDGNYPAACRPLPEGFSASHKEKSIHA